MKYDNLYIYITHWQKKENNYFSFFKDFLFWILEFSRGVGVKRRIEPLYIVLLKLKELEASKINIKIITNKDSNLNSEFINRFIGLSSNFKVSIFKVDTSNFINQFELTWEHKRYLKEDFLQINNKKNNLFIYLEHDQLFTQENLNYYSKYIEKLRTKQMTPGYLRMEFSSKNLHWYLTDQINFPKSLKIDLGQHKIAVLPQNSYFGFYIMDEEELKKHIDSYKYDLKASVKKHPNVGISELAASGNVNLVSNAKKSKINSCVIFNLKTQSMEKGSLVWHLSNRYADNQIAKKFRKFGSLSVEEYEKYIIQNL